MSWVWWLAAPAIATALTAIWTWWRARPPSVPNTKQAIEAHRDYLEALDHITRTRRQAKVFRDGG